MFASGEYVVHGYNGLCVVDGVTHLNMSGISKDAKYYILRPLNSEESKILQEFMEKAVPIIEKYNRENNTNLKLANTEWPAPVSSIEKFL